MKQKFFIHFVLLSIALISGCKSNNTSFGNIFKDFNKSKLTTDYIYKTNDFSYVRKKENFLPFTKNNARINTLKAINNHPLIKLAEKRIEITKSGIPTTLAQKGTQINLQGLAGVNRDNSENLAGASGSLSISKLLYDFGSIDKAILSQEERVNITNFQLQSKKQALATQAYSAWIDLNKNNKILEIYQEGINKAKPLLGQIKDISASGIADKAMILQAKKEYSELLIEYEKAKAVQLRSLNFFKDLYYGSNNPKVQELKALKVEKIEFHEKKMLKYHLDLKAQRSVIKSLKQNLSSLIARKKPTVFLKAGLTAPVVDPLGDSSANAGVTVNYIYNDGGSLDSQISSTELQIEASKIELQNLEKDLKLQLKLFFEVYNGALKTKLAAENLVEESREIAVTTNARLVSGGSKISEVFNAEVALAKNKIVLINAKAEFTLSSFSINSISSGLLKNL